MSLISSPPRSDHFCLEVIWLLIIWEPVPSFTNKLSLISGNVEFQSLISRDFHLEMYYKTEKSKSYAKEAEDTFPLHKVDEIESLNQISVAVNIWCCAGYSNKISLADIQLFVFYIMLETQHQTLALHMAW